MTRHSCSIPTAQRLLTLSVVFMFCPLPLPAIAASSLSGTVTDPAGSIVPGAIVRLLASSDSTGRETRSDLEGRFCFANLGHGEYRLTSEFPGFTPVSAIVDIGDDQDQTESIQFVSITPQNVSVTVIVDKREVDLLTPDPAAQAFDPHELVEANPGRPGTPVSIPGYPVETASGGLKAPQYFAPGVAGDHGEPVAQFVGVGGYLIPNNLSANAHGNGYADPNILVSQTLESVQIDGGAFNVREGNHSVNLAQTYGLRSSLDPSLTVSGGFHDIAVNAGLNVGANSWVAFEGAYGDGLLDRPEHRQQYKVNGERFVNVGSHHLTLLGVGYYGQSYIPGLVPVFARKSNDANFSNLRDSVDPRQKEQTHTALMAVNDIWQISPRQQVQVSSFFRTYNLSLFSDFGQGLIRQSEFRTVGGGNTEYLHRITEYLSVLGGLDYQRDAPRQDNLDHFGFFNRAEPHYYGPSTPVDANNVTIGDLAPYAAAEGKLTHLFRYYLGWRRDEISFDNQDLLRSQNSFYQLVGVNSPKATISFVPRDSWFAPLLSLSLGQTFFTADPRSGIGNGAQTLVAKSRSYQLVANKEFHNTDVRLTLGHVTNSAELAKIDPDSGLQINQGPSRLRFMTLAMRHNFSFGSLQTSISKADARDIETGNPTPEAPRTILDLLASLRKLPLHLQAKSEFELVGRKPLGKGCSAQNPNAECIGTPLKELRGSLVRPFLHSRLDVGLNYMIARGYTGQTTQSFYPSTIQQVVGVRKPSYASVSFTYKFGSSR